MKHEVISTGTLLKTWRPFRDALGFGAVKSTKDYKRAATMINQLVDEIGEDETHPLADLLDYVSNQVQAYETDHAKIPDAPPRDVLRFLMREHGLSQSDLADCAPQSRISEVLSGKRDISKEMAKAFAEKFHVPTSVFI